MSINNLLSDALGQFEFKSKGNLAFSCPFCNHRKKKLEVHPELGVWACWVCGVRGKSIKSLFTKLQLKESFFIRLKEYKPDVQIYEKPKQPTNVSLPIDFLPLFNTHNGFFSGMAYKYITEQRKCTQEDLIKYNIGYSPKSNMLIFPNYDKDGNLDYYTTRSFINGSETKFKNPINISRNVIGFEMQLNWELPLIICESALNAITIRINSTPIYGKLMSDKLKIAIFDNDVNDIYMCLDPDAVTKSMEYIRYLINFGINVYNVKLPANKDVNDIGYENIWDLILSSKKITESDVFTSQLNSILKKI